MARTTGNRPPRHPKPQRTIDLEASEVSAEAPQPDAASAMDEGSGAERAASPAEISGETPSQLPMERDDGPEQSEAGDGAQKETAAFSEPEAGQFAQEIAGSTDRDEPDDRLPEREPEQTPFAPPPPKRGGSIAGMIASALIGSVFTVGTLGALNQAGALSGIPLVGSLFARETGPSPEIRGALDELSLRLDRVSARLEANGGDMSSAAAITQLEARLAEFEASLANARESASQIATIGALAEQASKTAEEARGQARELGERILQSATGGIDMETVRTALAGETAALESRIAALEAGATGAADPQALGELRERIDRLAGDRLSALESSVNELRQEGKARGEEIAAVSSKLGALEEMVGNEIMKPMEEVRAAASAALEGQRVARSVTARALAAALEQGGPFASELASAETLAGAGPEIEALKEVAVRGLETPASLLSSFGPVADGILAAEQAADPGEGVVQRLISSARSLVKVRPAGPVEGDTTIAILSRVEAALRAGDLAGALQQWNSLDETARSAGAQWQAALEARIRNGERMNKVISDLAGQADKQG